MRERRGQTRDGHRHLTIERYPTNIILVNEMDRPLPTGPLARCEVENTLTVQGRSLPMEQPTQLIFAIGAS
jgi:hypothetical protein